MSFWSELKRRNVFKVAVAYLIVAWLIVQVVSIAFPAFHMPTWTVTFVMSLLIVGFPVVLIFAWAFEITPEGLKLTKDVPHHESITHVTGRKLNYVLAGLLIIAIGYIGILKFYPGKPTVQTDVPSTVDEQIPVDVEKEEAPKSIAVLPFTDLSPDSDQGYFVDGLSEELLNCIAKIPDLSVTSRTSAFTFKVSNKTVQEIASVLGVEHILEGSVRKAGDELRITAQLIRASDDRHIWSETYEMELKDIFDVQEEIATTVANELKVALGVGKSYKQLGGTENVEAYELYLSAKAQSNGIDYWNWGNRVLEQIDAALELDPEFALAWALKSSVYSLISRSSSDEQLKAAQRAIDIEPNLPEAHAALGCYSMSIGNWIEAELSYRKARDLGTLSSLIDGNYIPYLFSIAYYDKANKILEEALRNDPLNQRISSMYINSFVYLRDRQRAVEELNRCISLFTGSTNEFGPINEFFVKINFDEFSLEGLKYMQLLSEDQNKRIESPEDLLAELRHMDDGPLSIFAMLAAYFGDTDLAMDKTESMIQISPANVDVCWFPVMHEVRQLPRFKELVKEIGLVDYWEQFGWPDLCRPLDNGDFVCD